MTQNQPELFPESEKRKSIIYIDGFNMYNGSLSGTTHKWLNLEKYFTKLRQHEDVLCIKYFTAKMDGDKGTRQEVYLRALSTLSRVSVIVGRYKQKTVTCRVANCTLSGQRLFKTWEEKRTDVNIAVHMVNDALSQACTTQVLVSGDSDLVPALNMIKEQVPRQNLIVYVPARDEHRGAAVEIRSAADKDATLPVAMFKHCQFPAEIDDGAGGKIRKPSSW
jgi:uncharacterized LabA/DUF88 family protein